MCCLMDSTFAAFFVSRFTFLARLRFCSLEEAKEEEGQGGEMEAPPVHREVEVRGLPSDAPVGAVC